MYHGVGCLNYENGDYIYGNFRNGKSVEKVFNFRTNVDSKASWFIIDENIKKCVAEGEGFPTGLFSQLDGYKIVIERCYMKKEKFEDKPFYDKD